MPNKNIAVIGSGYWGKNLVRNFDSLGALGLICDKDEAVLSRFREQYPDVRTCLAVSDILKDESIEGVVIATPAETHFPLASEMLLAGKHVFVEKPLALEGDQATKLSTLANDCGKKLMVGHLIQYHPIFIRLKEMALDGELGRINYIYSNRLNLGKIRREENILWSFAPHDISMTLSLAGESPFSVIATGGSFLHKSIADVTTTHLKFPSGMQAHIFVSWLHPFKEQKLVVVGDKKMAVFDDTQAWENKLLLYPHSIKWEQGAPIPIKAEAERVDIPQDEPLRAECAHFLECMATGQTPTTDGEEGMRVLQVLKAAQQSLDTNGQEVCIAKAAELRSEQDYFVHETSYIDEQVEIGSGTQIWHFGHVMHGSSIGTNCKIGQNVVIGPDAIVGDGCKIQNNVSIYPGVTLEDEVFCGPSMVFTNVYNPRSHIPRMDEARETLVKRGATLGANCTIVCGNTIGEYAFIGAGAVVTKDVADHALMVGNPARQNGWICSCGVKLDNSLRCPKCNTEHELQPGGLKGKER